MPRKWPLALGLCIGLLAMTTGLRLGDDTAQGWQLAARYTARAGFFLLLATFTASALARLWPNAWTRALRRDRRWWGLGFAACHSVHLAALVTRLRLTGEPIEPVALFGGGAAYALLYAMVLTSNAPAQRALGRNWNRLHTVGIYFLWFVFLQSYLGAIATAQWRTIGLAFSTLALAALGLRIAARVRTKTRALPAVPG